MNKEKAPPDRLRWLVKNWAVPVGCGLLFLFLLKIIFFVGYVPSSSMEPAIKQGSFIFGVRLFSEPERGDVVVFMRENLLMVKRIAGVPGDDVHAGGQTLTVPSGYYFVLGDNEESSVDSRLWDEPFVGQDRIIAKIVIPRQRP